MRSATLTPWLPTYRQAQHFLRSIDGVSVDEYNAMHNAIYSQRGTPKEQVSWADPAAWIPERLAGAERELAFRIWRGSQGLLNPRHTGGAFVLCKRHALFKDRAGRFAISDAGRRFIENDEQVLGALDAGEGMLVILREIAEKGTARRADLQEGFVEFCFAKTNWRAESTVSSALTCRIKNLQGRALIESAGRAHQITDAGLAYLQRRAAAEVRAAGRKDDARAALQSLAKKNNDAARAQLAEHLRTMDPYEFEKLIKWLLEEMNYSDVEVTAAASDGGVDVIANIALGISEVREVVQVKRQRGSVGRPVLDRLRGVLHRFDAVRGTIITTGRFSAGAQNAAFEKGAPPITLIDGAALTALLVEYEIGIRKSAVHILEFAAEQLVQFGVGGEEG